MRSTRRGSHTASAGTSSAGRTKRKKWGAEPWRMARWKRRKARGHAGAVQQHALKH